MTGQLDADSHLSVDSVGWFTPPADGPPWPPPMRLFQVRRRDDERPVAVIGTWDVTGDDAMHIAHTVFVEHAEDTTWAPYLPGERP